MPLNPTISWEKTLSATGSTRGTGYMASSKIISHDGLVHVTWLDTPGTVFVQTLDLQGNAVTDPFLLNVGYDNHCGAAMTVDADGYLHVMCGAHCEMPFMHYVSREPWSTCYWWPGRPVSDSPTYPAMACTPDGALHLTYRWWHHIDADGGPSNYRVPPTLGYQRVQPGMSWEGVGKRRGVHDFWSQPAELVHPMVPRGYAQYGSSFAVDSTGRLHLGFHVYDDDFTKRGFAVGYLRSEDSGTTWTKTDGEAIRLPAGPDEVDVLELGDDIDMRVSNIAVGPDDNPAIVAFHREDGNAVLWEHDGSSWNRTDLLSILHETQPNRFFSMDGSISIDSAGNVFIAAQVVDDPTNWGKNDAEVVLFVRSPDGAWSVSQVSDGDPDVPSWHPSLERVTSAFQTMGTPYLLYTKGANAPGCETYEFSEIRLVSLEF
jgi:hypothetical protein